MTFITSERLDNHCERLRSFSEINPTNFYRIILDTTDDLGGDPMLAPERQKKILDLLTQQRIIKTQDIAEHLGISNLTARRDLDVLREQGYVRRVHGGAILIPDSILNPVPEILQTKKNAPKQSEQAIGKLAASMVEEGDVIFLGNGVVTFEVAKNLLNIPNLTFITGSMSIANLLLSSNSKLYILGGLVDPLEQNIYSRSAMDQMERFFPTISFMGCEGVTAEHGITCYYQPGAELGNIVVKNSAKTIITVHNRKFGTDSMNKVCELSDLYAIVTDDRLDPEYRKKMEQTGVKMFYAKTDPTA